MNIGEIYFIRERDRRDGGSSGYVKIGMVSDVLRGSRQRLGEHQTGNPRDLELHHVTQTPFPFRVERFLHQRFGRQRVRSEWFDLADDELADAISLSEQLAAEAFRFIPVIEKSLSLKTVLSSGQKIDPTSDSTDWLTKLGVARSALAICSDLEARYRAVIRDLPVNARETAKEEQYFVERHVVTSKFDELGFTSTFPDLVVAYTFTETKVSGHFVPKVPAVRLEEFDSDLLAFAGRFTEACDRVDSEEAPFSDLFDFKQDLERYQGSYKWDQEIADAHLRVLCGTSAGIEGQCTWNRVEKTKSEVDWGLLENDHPEEYLKFVTTVSTTRTVTSKRAPKTLPKG